MKKIEIWDPMSRRMPKNMELFYVEDLQKMMEEMAEQPKDKHGERQPGEKGSYERYRESDVGSGIYEKV